MTLLDLQNMDIEDKGDHGGHGGESSVSLLLCDSTASVLLCL
ncbi:SapB/AmfS family lanthipeptide [Streptomyces sp. CBMA152]|nr:SapB/AmfS family lanthipeptide [Streptomyces sp. CBMA152]MBD0747093.1 AmfS protein [Streptomyces sp. CBMA152]